ncbi:MAG: serine/threonine protein kinase, partial [Deltaproteobacteria bacterium]|nr:serine/threonine protein kinase [Deltaproteobacteria bacterium]
MHDDDIAGEQLTKREGQGRPERGHKRLERGTLVGRYVVFDILGEGGMGTVYNAYDPELDRRLAIKVVQAKAGGSTTTGGDQARLLREAQALARLSHPNVIAVHDVGTLPGDRVFVAMELVEGATLRTWLRDPRTWKEVQAVMLAAGAGLAAAHTAGLVHRDFKPENVIVGADGRVRVMDFGLARLAADEHTAASRDSNLAIETRSPLSAHLTIERSRGTDGNVVGTPAYMAPEIYDGEAADARTDQFAFGVALYEALYRTRPFERKALVPPRASPPVPKDPPASSAVPLALQRVVMRALAAAPADRYRAMDDLLADLAVDPARAKRRVLMAGGAVLVVAGTLSGAAVLARGSAANEMCTGLERRLEGVWDTPARDAVHAAFGRSKRPFALQAMVALEKTLDRYATEWTVAATENCTATRIRGDQTEDVLELRGECLDQRLGELQALARAMANADDTAVDRASTAEHALEPVARCANVAALRSPVRAPASALPQLAEI